MGLKEEYDNAIDIWAIGCLMAELYRLTPLFPGANETEQLNMIIKVLEPNSNQNIPMLKFQNAPSEAVDLLRCLLAWKPSHRISAKRALEHSYFSMDPF